MTILPATYVSARLLPRNWRMARLGELGRYINGRAFKPDEWSRRGIPIIRIENLNASNASFNYFEGEIDKAHKVSNGDLLISWSASLDAFIWNRGPAALNQHIFKVQVNKALTCRDFLFFAVKETLAEIKAKTHGATMSHITKGDFEAIEVPLPTLHEQKRIAAILNEQMAAVGKARAAAVSQVKAAQVLTSSILRSVFDVSDTRDWPQKRVGEFAKTTSGSTPSRGNPKYFGGSVPWIKTGELRDNLIASAEESVTELALDECSLPLLPAKTLLIAMYGQGQTRGRTGLLSVPATTNQACFAILPDLPTFEPRYLQYWFRHNYQRLRRDTEGRGGNQPNLNGVLLRNLEVPLPPVAIQSQIADALDKEFEAAVGVLRMVERNVSSFDSLPAALLRRAFSGQL